MTTRPTPTPPIDPDEARAELAKLDAEDETLKAQLLTLARQREALRQRRDALALILQRARV